MVPLGIGLGITNASRGASSSPPTLSLVTPNLGSAGGGWAIALTGTNFVSGGTTVEIDGVACTSVSVSSSTTLTCVTPAYSTSNGSASAQTVTVATSGGSASSSGIPTSYYYLPSNKTIIQFSRADVGVASSGGTVTQWNDQSGNANHWTATGTGEPAAPTGNFNGTGLPYIAFDGSHNFMEVASLSGFTHSTSNMSFYLTLQMGSVSGNPVIFDLTNSAQSGVYGNLEISSGDWYGVGVTGLITGPAADTNPHTVGVAMNGSSSWFTVDGSKTTGTLGAGTGLTRLLLGRFSSGSDFADMEWLCSLIYDGPLSSTDDATVVSILNAVGGT